jgi:hypothetical protein
VTAAGDQCQERRIDRLGIEVGRGDVPEQMVDRDQRQAPAGSDRLGAADADQQRADHPRMGRDRDGLDVVQAHSSPLQGGPDDGIDQLDVMPGSDLGHDPAVALVRFDLR